MTTLTHVCGCAEQLNDDGALAVAQPCLRHRAPVGALLQAGFTIAQAWALATSGPDTVFLVPMRGR